MNWGWKLLGANRWGKRFCMLRAIVVAAVLAVVFPISLSWASTPPPFCPIVAGTSEAVLNEGQSCRVNIGYDTYTITWTGDSAEHMLPPSGSTFSASLMTITYQDNDDWTDGGTVSYQLAGTGLRVVTGKAHLTNNDPDPNRDTTIQTHGEPCAITRQGGNVELNCGFEGDEAIYVPVSTADRNTFKNVTPPDGWTARIEGPNVILSVDDDNTVQRVREWQVGNHTVRFHDDDVARLVAVKVRWRQWDFILTRPVEELVEGRVLVNPGVNFLTSELNGGRWHPGESGKYSVNFGRAGGYYDRGRKRFLYHCVAGSEGTLDAWNYDENDQWQRPFGPREGSGLPMVIVETPEIDICRP